MTTLLPLGHFAPLLVLAAAILGYCPPGPPPRPCAICWPKLPRLAPLVLAVFGALQLVMGARP